MRPLVVLAVTLSAAAGFVRAADDNPASGNESGLFIVQQFGAVADGQTDDTAAIQKAIDAAAVKGGGVYLPPGRYRVAGHLTVGKGVAVKGANQAPQGIAPLQGTVILATGGRDNEAAPPLFQLGDSSVVAGVTIWYPEQKPTDIHPYPWTFQMEGNDNTVENVTLINSYNGVRTGPGGNVRHRIRSLYGCVLRRGIFVDNCSDIGRVEDCQLHCHWWSAPETGGDWDPVYNYMIANLEAFVFGRTDWEYASNNFVFPAKIGWRFIHTEQGECNGQFTGCGADACETAVQVDAVQPMGLLITGGQFVAFTGQDPVEVRINATCRGNVRFVNCAFWGPAVHNAVLKGAGYTSFSDCYFSSDRKDSNAALVVAESGRLQINNSTFASSQPSVQLGPDVRHAIIQGNNGRDGVRINDQTGGKAMLTNNEPPSPAPTTAPASGGHAMRPVHTFSIVARDKSTGQLGVAVQSHWFSVGAGVPWAEAGVGAVATQSFADPAYGALGLEMMRRGKSAPDALRGLLASDARSAVRQVAMVDAHGRVSAFTGDKCIAAAGHIADEDGQFSVQANMMESDRIWPAMAEAFRAAQGDLADRLVAALEAGQRAGGDIRGQQSAALIVVTGVPTGKPWDDRVFDLRVEDHPDPIGELKRLVAIQRAYNHMNAGDEAMEEKDLEAANREYTAAVKLAPQIVELPFWQAVTLASTGHVEQALPIFRDVFARERRWVQFIPRLAKVGLLPADPKLLEQIEAQAPR